MQVLTRVRGGCVVHRCQNKNPRERLTSGCEWRHAPEACGGFWEILKKSVSWVLRSKEERWLSLARRAYLFPYVEEPLNSKVIKSFVPELRSRKCFSCFEIPMFYVYMLWTVYVRFTPSHIWRWYTLTYTSTNKRTLGVSHVLC